MALDACPVPDLPHIQPPAAERSGTDITANPPVVRLADVQQSIEEKQAIDRFLGNLRKRCETNPSVLENISVTTYVIDGNLERIKGIRLFIVSDKRTGKVLSYHEEDGRCVLELDKRISRELMALDNAASAHV